MSNLKTRTKILILVVLAIFTTIAIGTMGSHQLNMAMNSMQDTKVNYTQPIIYMEKVESNMWSTLALLFESGLITDPVKRQGFKERRGAYSKENDTLMENFLASQSSGPKEDEGRRQVRASLSKYRQDMQRAERMVESAITPAQISAFAAYCDDVLLLSFRDMIADTETASGQRRA